MSPPYIGLEPSPIIVGPILGGNLAAPFPAYATHKLPDRPLMILVGAVIILFSLRACCNRSIRRSERATREEKRGSPFAAARTA